MKLKSIMITTMALMLIAVVGIVSAQNTPLGASNIDVERSESVNISLYDPFEIPALAGNLTELSITGISQTKSWQGFFGNVTGTITLEDAAGNRFYDWTATEPQGQVYASVNNTISWTTVGCAPMHSDLTYLNTWHSFYVMDNNDYDSINNTYTATSHPEIYVGYTTLNGCPTAYTFVNNASQSADFPSLLLTSDSDSTLIFTSVLENKTTGARSSVTGFDGGLYDFQLLVAEDGSAGNSATTPYYFWVEIN